MRKILLAAALAAGFASVVAAAPVYGEIEELGCPIQSGSYPVQGVTRDATGRATAWIPLRLADRIGCVGIDAASGKSTWIDIAAYGSRMNLLRCWQNQVFLVQGGSPARVLRYDPATGAQQSYPLPVNISYFVNSSADIAPDGKLYIGSYPDTALSWIDLASGKTGSLGRVSPDEKQKYILQILSDRDGVVYFTAGLHHPEVWSYTPATGEKRQILPEKYLGLSDRANIMTVDGVVYSWQGKEFYRCGRDGMTQVDRIPGVTEPAHASRIDRAAGPGKEYFLLDARAMLGIRDTGTGNVEYLKTDFAPFNTTIYSIRPGSGGKLWIGGFSPPALSRCDDPAGKASFINYGRMANGDTQIYDTLEYRGKLYTSSYGKGCIDEADLKNRKYTPVLSLFSSEEQERLFMLIPAADGKVYAPTMPIKGILGGGILEWDIAQGKKHTFYRNAIRNQSIRAICVSSKPELLFGASDIFGGSSSIPVEKSARVFLWDTAAKKTVWEAVPVEGEKIYMGAHRLGGNLAWTVGVYSRTLVVVDTVARKVVKTIRIPQSGAGIAMHAVGSAPEVFPDVAFVIGGDAIYAVDVEKGEVAVVVKSPLIQQKFTPLVHDTMAEYIAPDGTIYFGTGAKLCRIKPRVPR